MIAPLAKSIDWPDFTHAIHAFLERRVEVEKRDVSIVVGIVDEHGSRVVSCGKMDNGTDQEVNGDTLFDIASITKPFTGLLLQDMIERGEMKLEGGGDFLWLSAAKPIVAPGTPFLSDLQSWIRNDALARTGCASSLTSLTKARLTPPFRSRVKRMQTATEWPTLWICVQELLPALLWTQTDAASSKSRRAMVPHKRRGMMAIDLADAPPSPPLSRGRVTARLASRDWLSSPPIL
jgi:hypothetical protein